MRFLNLYRKKSESSIKNLIFPLSKNLESIIGYLPLYSLSAFLQYLYVCIVVVIAGVQNMEAVE